MGAAQLREPAKATVDIKLAAAIVIHRDKANRDRVLVVRRSMRERFLPGAWGVPCGKIDSGEPPEEAVVRELHEETGLWGEVVRPVGTSRFNSEWRGSEAHNTQFNYLMRVNGSRGQDDQDGMPAVSLPEEDQRSKWLLISDINSAGLDDHNLRAIRQALDN